MQAQLRQSRSDEAGYALLFVFAMAAAVALMLYAELPRVVFEQQREKEQLLIDRGEQYSRAIQLYVRKVNKYPQELKDLEDYQGQRFLRRQYKDPLTGGDWKILKINAAGVLENSLVQKSATHQKGKQDGAFGQSGSLGDGDLSSMDSEKEQQKDQDLPNMATVRGASDKGSHASGLSGEKSEVNPATGMPYLPGESSAQTASATGQNLPVDPATGLPVKIETDPITGKKVYINPATGQPYPEGEVPSSVLAAAAALASQTDTTASANTPASQTQENAGLNLASPLSGMSNGGFGSNPYASSGSTSGSAFGGTSGATTGAPPNSAADLIRKILTTPRPGGLQGLPGRSSRSSMGAGIAGVASKAEATGIKVYNDQTAYNKWEFVYDYSKDKAKGGSTTQNSNVPNNNNSLNNSGSSSKSFFNSNSGNQ